MPVVVQLERSLRAGVSSVVRVVVRAADPVLRDRRPASHQLRLLVRPRLPALMQLRLQPAGAAVLDLLPVLVRHLLLGQPAVRAGLRALLPAELRTAAAAARGRRAVSASAAVRARLPAVVHPAVQPAAGCLRAGVRSLVPVVVRR